MIWREKEPLPGACRNCNEECYNCDIAGERWVLSQVDTLRIKRKMMVKAIERLERKIQEIDRMLDCLKEENAEITEQK